MSSRSQDKAFTLIEMLIAMAIIGMIVSMVYGSYAATSRSLDICNKRMTCSGRAHLVLRLMARQIRGACTPSFQVYEPVPSRFAGPGTRPIGPLPQSGTSGTLAGIFQGDSGEARGEILCFATTGGLSSGPDRPAGLSRISYQYEAQSGVLSLSCEPFVYASDGRQSPPIWRPILSGVTGVDLEFHDGRQWRQRWDWRETGALPQAVKIALTIMDESGREHHYETAVLIAGRSNMQRQRQQKIPAGQL
jgi:prepilin-type N-terminal cleavage/methylation domain-containing protein